MTSTEDIMKFFASQQPRRVVTFLGYSGSGYEDPLAMLRAADAALDRLDPNQTIINIGATAQGVGAIYDLAKRKGFMTTGIVSTQAREQGVALASDVDHVFYVEDPNWGGVVPGTRTLSPTSSMMVAVSDEIIALGGGDAARDEYLEARRLGKRVTFVPCEMDHDVAKEKARRQGLEEPRDFRGSAHRGIVGD